MFFKTIISRTLQAIPESFPVILPQNIRSARLIVSGGTQGRDGFVPYICCTSCHSLYFKEHCVISNSNGLTESRNVVLYDILIIHKFTIENLVALFY